MAKGSLWVVYNLTLRQQVGMKPSAMSVANKLLKQLSELHKGYKYELRSAE